ncbi:heat shock 70 kDa protein 16-like [Cynara cardunculus var. scolymus]|uniref:Heat shock protein 70 family n=1 Tax=Cynara cardunculus var. scolymus TaxID=59895 RepID=A0A103XF56_CYNCS|nr:heat shock 70 kDa protein 16-like [Cynara cardunculus var. scolymus]KVH89623.1 Heat shock protein 70 family [Cynara cardunculus var. scolymus]
MSVVGFDIGNENCVIAAAKQGGIDVLLNDESKRETPAVVSFGEKQRFLGSAGAASATMNPKSTISQVKRLIGRRYKDVREQEDLRLLPFETSESSNGGVLIHLQYLNDRWDFTPVQILGMLFAHLKQMAEKNLESPVVDCVIGIPSYFTDFQRRDYLDAAFIAGLRPLRLMHDGTAIALGYGMYKTEFAKSGPTNVVFVDIGHCDTQVTVAAFEQGQMRILSHSFDQHLGGRDFDDVLFKHFAAQFKEQYNIDVYSNTRASIRLRASCEKLKKVLSANAEAPLSIECLMDEKDVKGFITRQEFENLSLELLERITFPCCQAVNDSGLSDDKIYSIELVGSGSRIPAIMRKLTSLFRKEPRRTLNASECVARGCALQCAMLSPTLRVRDYEVQDSLPFSIGVRSDEGKNNTHPDCLFPKGGPFPSTKMLTYHRRNTFYLQVSYETDFPARISPIGYFMIGPLQTSGTELAKVKVKVCINIHGIFQIVSASLQLLEDAHSSSNNGHLHSEKMVANSHMSNDAADHKSADSSPSTTYHADERRKGWVRRQNVAVSEKFYATTTRDELRHAQETEQKLAYQDMKVEQTKEKRNTLESYVYDARSKILSSYRSFATSMEKDGISKSLQETEEWLYEDGDDESEEVYTRKLEDLRMLLDPIENRYKDEKARAQAIRALQACVAEYRSAADSLPPSQKEEVNRECNESEQWLNNCFQLQESLPKNVDPICWSSDINEVTRVLERTCEHIMSSKSSSPKYDDATINPDQTDVPDDMQVD